MGPFTPRDGVIYLQKGRHFPGSKTSQAAADTLGKPIFWGSSSATCPRRRPAAGRSSPRSRHREHSAEPPTTGGDGHPARKPSTRPPSAGAAPPRWRWRGSSAGGRLRGEAAEDRRPHSASLRGAVLTAGSRNAEKKASQLPGPTTPSEDGDERTGASPFPRVHAGACGRRPWRRAGDAREPRGRRAPGAVTAPAAAGKRTPPARRRCGDNAAPRRGRSPPGRHARQSGWERRGRGAEQSGRNKPT